MIDSANTPYSSRLWQHVSFIKECRAKRMNYRQIAALINEHGTQITESGFRKFMARLRKRGGKVPFLFPEDTVKKPIKPPASDSRPEWAKKISQPVQAPEDLDLGYKDPTDKFMTRQGEVRS